MYSARELEAVSGDFSVSEFVSSITGVDNVCERAAVLASGNGRLIVKKHAGNGVTVAAAVREPGACVAGGKVRSCRGGIHLE